jgi:hypothetical protein
MRIGRNVIIPLIVALGVAGSVLASAEMSAAAAATPIAHVQHVVSVKVGPDMKYHN